MMHPILFGLNPFWVALCLFLGSYALIMSEKINRAIVALLGAGLLIISGVLSQDEAIKAVDFNTLGLLAGMMVIVHITSKTGVFEYLALWAARRAQADPWRILLLLSVITALCSALLDNVTTVLLIVPVILSLTQALGVSAYPYLFSAIFSSNIGGTATLIGDPPNIMIGSAVRLTFNDFLMHTAPVAAVAFIATMVPIYLIWGKKLHATADAKQAILALNLRESIKDTRLLKLSLSVLFVVMAGFMLAHRLHLEPATIAMTGAALLLLLENLSQDREDHHKNVHAAFAEAEWVTLFFFVGLFILVAGLEKVGIIHMVAEYMLHVTHNDLPTTALTMLWVSSIASAFVDNIPFVATMIPLIKSMAPALGGNDVIMPLWWSLSLGACLGGNGTLIGASANLVVAGMAERAGSPIHFVPFLLHAMPLMLMSIAISSVYIYLRYLM